MSASSEMNKLIRQVEKTRGWRVQISRGNHWKVFSPTGRLFFFPSTPGDARSLMNTRAELRRAGLTVNL